MDWLTCGKCGFTQIPSGQCLRCGEPLANAPPSTEQPLPPRPRPAERPSPPRSRLADPRLLGALGAGLLLLVVMALLLRGSGSAPPAERSGTPRVTRSAVDLSGVWTAHVPLVLAGDPPRPALKEAFLETDRTGSILAAGVTLTDPGRGGAGGGYRIATDGRRRLDELVRPLIAQSPDAVELNLDFIRYAPWVPQRRRVWRALEGLRNRPEEVRYLLLESVEDDYLVQAGINESGFLSYVFFSEPYASGRGIDAISPVIHPEAGSSLSGFQNLVWDFSGAADFLSLNVQATVSGPEGIAVRQTLVR